MRLTFHIVRKDMRRLWWEAAVAAGILAALAQMDAQRADFIPSAREGLFNLLLPAAWCYLVALAVQEEALAGDRQFWITRPYPRMSLLAAKALVVLLFIHLPAFLADAAILAARDFAPWQHIAELIGKQVWVAGAFTIPAFALATITRNMAQFVLAALAAAGMAVIVAGAVEPFSAPSVAVDKVRRTIALLALDAASAGIIFLQYTRRRTALSRGIAIAAALAAALLFTYLPRSFTSEVQCALSRNPIDRPLSIAFASGRQSPPRSRFPQFAGVTARFPWSFRASRMASAFDLLSSRLRLTVRAAGIGKRITRPGVRCRQSSR